MVLLDADSIMSGETIVRLVGVMESNPRLGIFQSLIVGVLCPSLFGRLFEYGHRHALRCSITGSSWWQGDRCQYWGHNAVIRIAPFAQYCEMPFLPGKGPFSGHIFCHDQIEASFMHRAGYEVRILPEESGSYEGVPPTLFDFNRRNNRWCQGNLKNLRVVFMSGLSAIDRFQLLVVAQRFLSHPALVAFLILATFLAASWPVGRAFPGRMAIGLYAIWMFMFFSPKLFGIADVLLKSSADYGGVPRLLFGACMEFLHSMLLTPISSVATTIFIFGIPFKGRSTWDTNRRNAYALTWRDALRDEWPQTVLGASILIYLLVSNAAVTPWFAPFLLGLIFAIPFAVMTSLPRVNAAARRFVAYLKRSIFHLKSPMSLSRHKRDSDRNAHIHIFRTPYLIDCYSLDERDAIEACRVLLAFPKTDSRIAGASDPCWVCGGGFGCRDTGVSGAIGYAHLQPFARRPPKGSLA